MNFQTEDSSEKNSLWELFGSSQNDISQRVNSWWELGGKELQESFWKLNFNFWPKFETKICDILQKVALFVES